MSRFPKNVFWKTDLFPMFVCNIDFGFGPHFNKASAFLVPHVSGRRPWCCKSPFVLWLPCYVPISRRSSTLVGWSIFLSWNDDITCWSWFLECFLHITLWVHAGSMGSAIAYGVTVSLAEDEVPGQALFS